MFDLLAVDIDPATVGTIIAAVIMALGTGAGGVILGRRSKTTTEIENQPLTVKEANSYIQRHEFTSYKTEREKSTDQFRKEVRESFEKLDATLLRVFAQIDARDKLLGETIKEVATTAREELADETEKAHNGRQAIWEEVNRSRERLAAVEATCRSQHPPTPLRSRTA
jgi:coproporphyrinogen III oxidase-like Fe-S oxidoreductase